MSGRTKKKKRRVNNKNTARRQVPRANNSSPIRKPAKKGELIVNSIKNRKNKNQGKKGGRKKHTKLVRALIIIAIVILLVILIALGVFAGIFFSDKFALTKEDLLIGTSNTMIYDSEGNLIAELSGKENRKIVSIDEMSPYLPKAFVAIEDERFYEHKGVDIKRTAAATFTYLTHSGSSNFGGSTITQQLVKNITNEKESSGKEGMQRKIREMSRAYQIEKMIEKKDILELYLNLIPLASSGGDICGVEVASMFYFNKSSRDLSIEECAFLAGVTHSPSQYNPYKENPNTERIKSRTKTVLGKMKDLGYITGEEYNNAIAKVDEGLHFEKGELPSSSIKDYYISAAVEQVVKDLVEQKGMSEEYARSRIYGGGLKIYTAQVKSIQDAVQNEYKQETYVKPATDSKAAEGAHTQSAMVIIDHKTGRIVGCMGGLGTDVDAIGINRINSLRQPGSSIKPIGVYGPSIEKGIINASTIYDNTYPTYFGPTYHPNNASNQKTGLCTVRDALEVSSNIVACKVMTELGPDNAIDFMRQEGITSLVKDSESTNGVSDSNTSLALGTASISPLEMAAAYATIANDGVYIQPTFYTKVEDASGNVILEPIQKTERVYSEGNAYIMKSLLKQPVEGGQGTARICRMDNIDVGAKTGTTQDQKDVWLCGFTPYYTAATWYGYDTPEALSYYGGSPATLIWNTVMRNVHQGLEGKRFDKPGNVVAVNVCRTSGKCATSACKDTYTEYFVEGAIPGKCEGHNSFKICTESKKLATEYCEHTDTVWGLAMPEKEVNAKWKTNSGDKYTVITEKCDIHTAEAKKKADEEKAKKEAEQKKNQVDDSDVKVTNVVGMSEAAAKSALAGLNVSVTYKEDSKNAGKVISQSIKADTVVAKNAKIAIVVGKAEEKKPEPTTPTQPQQPSDNDKENNQQNATN